MKANNTILPAKALADLAHNQHEVVNVYSHPFTYWDGETTTEYIFIVRVKDGRLMLLSCTDIVTIPSTVCSPDDRRVYFPAEELDKLVKRAEMLTKDDNNPDNTTPETSETMNTDNTPATMNETNDTKKMYTDYKTAVNWLHSSLILCNNIEEVDPSIFDNVRFAWYNEETERDTEIFQWFITDCSEDDVEFLERSFPGLLFSYSDMLDVFVLCVDHFGTPWSGVHIETTLENAAKENI